MWSLFFRRIYNNAYSLYFYGMGFIRRGYRYFLKEEIKTKPVDVVESYIEKNKKKFLQSIETPSLVLNKNISPVFYLKKDFQAAIRDDNNDLENEWKTRILFENTPRGNVIMYYNPFKLGFTYYADQYIPYDILNSVAMKYVITYRCSDFFMDELILPEAKKSPLMVLLQEDKKEVIKGNEKEKEADTEFKNKLKSAPFAKLKNYKTTAKVNDKKESNDEKKTGEKKVDEKQKERNRFINMGKMQNYKFLKVTEKKKVDLFSSTTTPASMIDYLMSNSSVQKEVFSYRDFKNANKRKDIYDDVNSCNL